MTYPNRFTHVFAFAAFAIFLLPSLHAQTVNNTTTPANNSGNMIGNHKDVMSTSAPPSASGTSQQGAEVRTEKLKVKQTVVDDNDPKKHVPPATAAPSPDNIQKKHVANITAAPGDDNNPIKHVPPGSSTSTSTSSSATVPQTAQDKTKFKQEFGPTQANKKN